MDGILIIDKPAGWTSHDVVAKLRGILRTKRIGHTGTLDPFATGVLVMLIGKATRLAQFLDKDIKEYEAVVRLGFETDTGDLTGNVKRKTENGKSDVSSEQIKAALEQFRGELEQVPPMYSAKKIEGKKLYDLARQGVEVERKPVIVTIYSLELIEPPRRQDAESVPPAVAGGFNMENTVPEMHERNGKSVGLEILDFGLRVSCSAGTYIRTLAEDIGRVLGTGAHLAQLKRIAAGKFKISQAITLEEAQKLADSGEIEARLISMNDALLHLPEIKLSEEELAKVKNGIGVAASFPDETVQIVRMTDAEGLLAAVGQFDRVENVVRPRIVFSNN